MVFILKMAKLHAVVGSTVELNVEYQFHKDKLLDNQCKKFIEEALSKFLKQEVFLNVHVIESEKQKADKQTEKLAAAFGGTVVS